MKMTPIDGWVIAEPIKVKERTTKSGLVLAGVSESIRFVLGRVIEAAELTYHDGFEKTMPIKKGDLIYFDEFTAREFDWNGTRYYTIEGGKVYCIIELTKEEQKQLVEDGHETT